MKEVKYRKVLQDDGDHQLVELEQLASWRFLWLSGTLSACVLVDQDRSTHMVICLYILRSALCDGMLLLCLFFLFAFDRVCHV